MEFFAAEKKRLQFYSSFYSVEISSRRLSWPNVYSVNVIFREIVIEYLATLYLIMLTICSKLMTSISYPNSVLEFDRVLL